MKEKKKIKRLSLTKSTVAKLNNDNLNGIKGGVYSFPWNGGCPTLYCPTYWKCDPTIEGPC